MTDQIIFNQKDAAKLVGVHPNTFRRWTNEGRIKKVENLPGTRYHITDLMSLSNTAKAQEQAA